MGLSSWIQKLLARTQSAKPARSPREDFVQLYLNRLEDRRVLNADASVVGNTLVLDNFTAGESLTVRENGANYEFELAAGGAWDTTGSTGVGSAAGQTYSVSKTELAGISNGLQIVDPAGNDLSITFEAANFSALVGSLNIDGAGAISQSGIVTLTTASLDIDAASINLNNANNDLGTVILNSATDAALSESNGFTLNRATTQGDLNILVSSGDLTLAGNLNTDGTAATGDEPAGTAGLVNIGANVILGNDVVIDTDAATTDGSLTISGTVNSDGNARDLTIESGNQATQITQAIGTGTGAALDQLHLNAASGTGTIQIQNIGSTGSAGANTISIGNTNSSSVTFQGTEYVSSGAQLYQATSGDNFSITASTGFESGAGADIDFSNANVILATGADLEVTTGTDGTSGLIYIRKNLHGDLGGASTSDVVLNAATVRLFGGSITGIQSLLVNSKGSASISTNISTSSSKPMPGDNFVQFNSAVSLAGITIDTSAGNGDIRFLGNRAEGNGGDLTLDAGSGTISATQFGDNNNEFNLLNITAGTFELSQGIRTRAQGGIAGDVTMTVSTAFNLTGDVLIDTTVDHPSDLSSTADGDLMINGPIDGASQTLNLTVGSLSTSSNITTAGLTVNPTGTANITGQIRGTGGLTKEGSGTLVLNSTGTANDFTGTTAINAGTLQLGSGGQITDTSVVAVAAAGTLALNDQTETIAQLTGSGNVSLGTTPGNNLRVGDANDFTFDGVISGNGNLVKLGNGTMTLAGVNTYTGTTNITAGESQVDGEIGNGAPAGTVILGAGTTLSGSGTINAPVQINGTLSPGNSPGQITMGDLDLEEDSTFIVEIEDDNPSGATAGGDYDQVVVNGTLAIGSNVTLDLSDLSSTQIEGGDVYTIVDANTVTGEFQGLTEGTDVAGMLGLGSEFTATLSYMNGDVTIAVSGPTTFTSPGGGLTSRVVLNDQGTGNVADDVLEFYVDGTLTETALLSGVTEILVNGDAASSDSLIVDFSGGIFTQPLTYDGGAGSFDTLIIQNGTFQRVWHNFTGSDSGNLTYSLDDDLTTLGDQATINYVNLEPVDMTGSTITNLVFNLPNADNQAILEDEGTTANGISQIRSQNANFETTTFATPTGSLTINIGNDDPTFEVADVPDFDSTLNILADSVGTGVNAVHFTGSLDLGATGSLRVEADSISMDDLTSVQTNAGTLTLTATGDVELSRLLTNNATVTVETTGGAIIDHTAAEGVGSENIVANAVILRAATGIGSGTGVLDEDEDIDINGGNLTAVNTASGAIQIVESDSIALNSDNTNSPLATVNNAGRTVVIDAGAAITDADTTLEGAGNENIVAAITRLRAVDGIGTSGTLAFGDGEDIDISGGTLFAENTGTGSIQIFSGNDLALGQILDNANAGQTVLIESAGNITDVSTDETLPNLAATNAGLKAAAGIGAGANGDLDTSVDVLTAITVTGDIDIEDTGDLEIGDVGSNTPTGVQITSAASTDNISVTANGSLTITEPVRHAGTGNITLDANAVAGNLNINADVTTNFPGSITLTAGQDVTLNSSGLAMPTVEVLGMGSSALTVTPRNGVVTGTGLITIEAGDTTSLLGNNSTIRNLGRVIQITTDDLDIPGTSQITTGATLPNGDNGAVMIRNATAGQTIQLGGAGAGLNIDNTELQRITTNSLRIGRLDGVANAGDIQFTGNFLANAGSITTVQLFTGESVTQSAGVFSADEISIFAGILGQMGATANGNVKLGNANNNAIRRLAVSAGGSIQFLDNDNDLNVDRIKDLIDDLGEGGNNGVVSQSSFVDLRAMDGNLTVRDTGVDPDISAGGVNGTTNLAINLLANPAEAVITIDSGATISSMAGAHRYTADNMDIDTNGTITAGANLVVLRNATSGIAIDLGDANAIDDLGVLELTVAELDNITTNLLVIGSNNAITTGNITITNAISPANTDTLHLIANGMITDTGAGAIIETNLIIEAANAVTLDNILANDVDNLSALITGGSAASFTFRDGNQIHVESLSGLLITDTANDSVGTQTFAGIKTQGGDVLLEANTGVTVTAGDPIDTSAGAGGGSITIHVLMAGDILIDAPLVTTGMTTGGDINLSTLDGNITTTANGTLTATGTGAFAGGDITLTAGNTTSTDSDATVGAAIKTNNGGNIEINADDAVTLNANLATTGAGTIAITANNDVTNASTDGGNGSITMGSITMGSVAKISTDTGLVTLMTQDDNLDEASIFVEQITTKSGDVRIDANGVNADVELRNMIRSTTGGGVTIEADDSVTFLATASIVATGAGAVLVRADDDDQDGNSGDQILMNDDGANNAYINAGSGTIRLENDDTTFVNDNGGNITMTQIVTTNASPDAVRINSNRQVLDGGDSDSASTGGADIEAIAAGSSINITAVTGVGTGDALETSGVFFDIDNTGTGTINIVNTVDNLAVVIDRLTTTGEAITFINDDPDNLTPGQLTIQGTGVVSTSNTGTDNDITITTEGALTVAAPLNTQGGTDGTFTLTGGATFTAGAAIQLGTGDINLASGGVKILINTDLTIDGGPASFYAAEDIIVSARLETTATNGDLLLSADNTGPANGEVANGSGGVLVRDVGQVVSSGTLILEGSNLVMDGMLVNALPGGIENGVHIERDAGNMQLDAQGDLTLRNRPGIASSDIVFGGIFGTQNGNVLIDANDTIFIADDATITGPGGVTFGDATGRDPVIDDGDAGTPSNLTINSSGTVVLFGRVGDAPSDPTSQRIDSLKTDAGGQTHLRGGFVSTHGEQFYGDDVFLNTDTNLVNSTSFTTTNDALNAQPGNVTFSGVVRGLDLDPASNTLILDDITLNVAGKTEFNGFVGADPLDPALDDTQRIGDGTGQAITINSSGETEFNGNVFTESGIRQNDAAGRVTFNANAFLDDGTDHNIDSLFLSDVTLNRVTIYSNGNLTFGSGNINTDQLLIAGGSKLDTTGRDFTSPNRLTLEAGTETVPSRNITINSLVTDPVQTALIPNEDLTLNLNTGDLLINGSVGTTTNRFGNLIIQSANDFLFGPTRTQILLSESLQQFTGVDDGADRAVTQLSSTVDTTLFQGIRIATTDVVYDSVMRTNGQRALTQAQGTVMYSRDSSLTTAGGMVVTEAVEGEILMQESGGFTATIDAGGGPVVLQAFSHVHVSQIRTVGGFVSLTSLTGQVIDEGDQTGLTTGSIGTHDIQAAQLRLAAGSGIGTTTSNRILETLISNLEATNGTNGIAVTNTGDLTIGGVQSLTVATLREDLDAPLEFKTITLPPLNGVSTESGNIDLVATGSMTVNEDIRNQGQNVSSNINLTAMTGNFTVNQTTEPADATPNVTNVQADNGSVNINAAGNITMNGATTTSAVNGSASFTAGNTFTANNATTVSAVNGVVDINAAGNVEVNGTTNISATNGKVDIDAGGKFSTQFNTVIRGISSNVEVTTGGNAEFRGFVESTNGSDILVDVGGNFILRDGFMPFDMQVGGGLTGTGGFMDGEIIVVADGKIDFNKDTNAVIRSRTGVIRAVDRTDVPMVRDVRTPQVSILGEAELTFTVGLPAENGLPAEQGFYAIVDWGDGTTTVQRVNAGQQTLRHTYAKAPNPNNPGAPIQVILVVVTDPNIHFFGTNNALLPPGERPLKDSPTLANPSPPIGIGNFLEPQEPPLTVSQFIDRALNPRDRFNSNVLFSDGMPQLFINNLDVVTSFPVFPVPISGFGSFAIEIEEEPPPFFIRTVGVVPLPEEVPSGEEEPDDLGFAGSEGEEQAEEEIIVKLRVLSPSGQTLYEYAIPQIYLSDPSPLWQKLPNGRYQIVIEEPGRSIPIVVRDVELKDHQVIRRFDRTRRNDKGDNTSQNEPNAAAPLSMNLSNIPQREGGENPLLSDAAPTPANGPAGPDQIWENWQRLPAAKRSRPAPPKREATHETQAPAAVAALTGGLALGALSRRSSDEADSQMMQFTKRAVSPAARLRRRLRK